MLGVIAMVMGVFQTEIMPELVGFVTHDLGPDHFAGPRYGRRDGVLQGAVVGYLGVPAFIVTLGGF